MANGSGAPAATPNPFGQQQQPMQTAAFGSGQGQTATTLPAVAPGFGGQQQPMQTAAFGSGQGQMPSFAMLTQALGDPATVSSEYPTASFGDMQNRLQPPQQSLSFDQWKKQPRIQDQQYRTPEQQAQIDQQAYQQYLSGTNNMQVAQPVPLQNPFQPQQPSFMQDPEYQGYQTQANDLQRQMNEYMQKAPMYQQMQDLQNKMAPFQQRYYQQQQDMQRMQQPLNRQRYDPIQAEQAYYERMASQRQQPMQQRQFNPYQQQQQYRQPAGIQGLMGMLGGKNRMQQAQPRMSMDMPQARPAVMPRSFGREQRYAMPSRDYSRIGSAGAARPADSANFAVVDEAPVMNPAVDYFPNSW